MKILKWLLFFLFILANIVFYNHAYSFTHFSKSGKRTQSPESLPFFEKLTTLFKGVSIPKPQNTTLPSRKYETLFIQSHEKLETWLIEVENHKGIVVLFHGYSSCKSGILNYAEQFNEQGYSTLLVDFMGSGGSEGYQTTIGFLESKDVKVAFDLMKQKYPTENIYLMGSSMGAVAIMKSIQDYAITPDKIILECPFGTMVKTTQKRFEAMNLPSFPFAQILLVYGGFINGFNPFSHQPTEYAKQIDTPTLLMSGKKDGRVTLEEVEEIFGNLTGPKKLKILEKSGHENYLVNEKGNWVETVFGFLNED